MKTKDLPAPPQAGLFTVSNGLSMLRMLFTIPVMWLLLDQPYAHRGTVLLIALAAYISDLSDGWIARRFKQESDWGRIIDPLADKVFVIGTVIAMIVQHILPVWFVTAVIVRDILIFAGGMHLRSKTKVLVQSTFAGKATVVSICLVLIASLFQDSLGTTEFKLLMLLSFGFMVYSLYTYAQRYFRLLSTRKK